MSRVISGTVRQFRTEAFRGFENSLPVAAKNSFKARMHKEQGIGMSIYTRKAHL
ncbi:hypothetical protein [Alistipes sp.]|uniref:hypothetical protein n=1 Tax=Alistipes sp. TaxID=1872444 RepID=UPI0025C4D022|nr:hypothetical protein [Alistipes sp.]